MRHRSFLRVFFGICVGAFAGISMSASVVPFVVGNLFFSDSFTTLLYVRPFILPFTTIWAVCGGILGWLGGMKVGVLTLGVCGFFTGLILGIFAFGGSLGVIGLSILCGLIYGAIGGLILGGAFPKHANESN